MKAFEYFFGILFYRLKCL